PHMSVYDNMAYGLRIRHLSKQEIETRVQKAAAILELGELLQRTPRQLSGGQRQRVAMGRAIVREPAVFLFDEPLSNLDAKLRVQMRLELQKLHRQLGTTSLYVTHDQVEAMTLGQRLIVMNAGRAEQIGTPAEVYRRPASMFVASFIGSPPMNLLRGRVSIIADGVQFEADGATPVLLSSGCRQFLERDCVLGVRPENLVMGQPGLTVVVEMVEMLGADLLIHGRVGTQSLILRVSADTAVAVGDQISAGFDASALHWFDPQTTRRLD
ncbi:MAG: ATP-binding cassette domain-containing protein, partial [Herbaspirillum sp.]